MEEANATVLVNLAKVREVEDKLIEVLQQNKLTRTELLTVLGIILVDAGASLEEIPDISMDQVYYMFAEKPTYGRSLMCIGADILREWLGYTTLPEEQSEKE